MGNNFLGQTVSFGICQGVVFSRDKIHCLDPSKQPQALANLWTLASLTSQIQNAKLRLRLRSAFEFFNLASLSERPGQMASVVFQGPDNFIFFGPTEKDSISLHTLIQTLNYVLDWHCCCYTRENELKPLLLTASSGSVFLLLSSIHHGIPNYSNWTYNMHTESFIKQILGSEHLHNSYS